MKNHFTNSATNSTLGGSKGDRPLYPYEKEQAQLNQIRESLSMGRGFKIPQPDAIDKEVVRQFFNENAHSPRSCFNPIRKHFASL
jgi:hypothetical protein